MSAQRPANAAEIRSAVRGILSSVGAGGDLAQLQDGESLLAAGIVDSMAMVGLVSALEERFGINISDDELVPEHFDSVQAIVALVAGKTGA